MNTIIKEDINNILSENLPFGDLNNKTVLVTGANGFIPSYVVETLLALKTVRVIGVVRNKEKADKKFKHHLDNKNLEIIVQDISTPLKIDEKIDYIIHAASQASPKYYGIDPVGTLKANTIGTYNLLELARQKEVKKFLFFSTGEVYGVIDDNTPQIKETYTGNLDCTCVRSCYGESKRMGETMCVCYSFQYNIPVNMIRLSHTYGPGVELNDGRVFGDFTNNVINNQNIVLNSDGSATRSFCYISDMIRALFYVLFFGEDKNAYNIASQYETSILDLAKIFVGLYPNKNLEVEFKDGVFQKGYIKSASTKANFSVDKLKKLGWEQKVGLKEGFKRMLDSYQDLTPPLQTIRKIYSFIKEYSKNILITGANGFIGKNLKEALQYEYFLYTPRSFELNLLDRQAVKNYLSNKEIDLIIHCSSIGGYRGVEDKDSTLDDNIAMVNNLLQYKNEKTKVILFGSGAMYDKTRSLQKVKESEIGKFEPRDLYGKSKLLISRIVNKRDDILCLNIFGCYGKYEKESRFPTSAIKQNLAQKPIVINQNVVFDYLYIDDLSKIILRFIKVPPKEKIINITPNESILLSTIAQLINEISDYKSEIILKNPVLGNEYTGCNSLLMKEIPDFEFSSYKVGLKKLKEYISEKN